MPEPFSCVFYAKESLRVIAEKLTLSREFHLCLQASQWRTQLVGGICQETLLRDSRISQQFEQFIQAVQHWMNFCRSIAQVQRTQIAGRTSSDLIFNIN